MKGSALRKPISQHTNSWARYASYDAFRANQSKNTTGALQDAKTQHRKKW